MLLAVLIVLNIPVFLLIGWLMFDTGAGFVDTLKSYFTPAIIHTLRGEHGEGTFAGLKLAALVVACGLVVYGEHQVIVKWFY
ncbi:MAG: hypothetical protein ACYSWU_18100 [Planctomycetota bacterium]|jgi:hypothetical protein